MRILSLDTASPFPSLSAAGGSGVGAARALPPNAAESLPLAARSVLADSGFAVTDLERVAVVSGPGSFTGLRAGLAFGRGLARARAVPLVLVTTFEAAHEALPEPGDAVFVLDAGRGDVHSAARRDGEIAAAAPPRPRIEVESDASARGLPVLDLGLLSLPLAAAAARIASRGQALPGALLYGRPSAAEERRTASEARGARDAS